MKSRAQNSLEYLMLIAGAVLIAVVILLLLSSGIIPTGGTILTNNLGIYNNYFGNGGNFSPPNLCANGVSNGVYDAGTGEECDNLDIPAGTDCTSLGFGGGSLSCTAQCSIDTSACVPPGEPVSIIRDTWGVPHVFATSDEGAFFGWGFVAAQDRWYQMDWTRMQMRGRISELVGSAGIIDDESKRIAGYAAYEERRYPNLSPSTRAALDAYAAGVNHYLTTRGIDIANHPMAAHPYFSGRALEPWTPVDSLLVWNSVFLQGPDHTEVTNLRTLEALPSGSTNQDICDAMNFTYFIDNDAAVVQPGDMPTAGAAASYAGTHTTFCNGLSYYYPPPKASHGWAVGGSRSTTGNTILHGDPQILLEVPSLFHEVHVSGSTFNARGVNTPGSVGFFVGFNANTAWTGTKLGADTDDIFRLEMAGPLTYRSADNSTHSFVPRTETINVNGGSPMVITVYDTQYGPVVTDLMDPADVNPGEQYIWRSSLFYNMNNHTVDATLDMLRAQSVNDIASAMEHWYSPTANIIFGDSSGSVGYWYGARPPMRDSDSPVPGFIAQDTDNDWVELIPHNLLPHTINPANDIVFSANHLPIGDWYPIYLGSLGGGGDTIRSYRLRQLLGASPGDPGYVSQYSPQDVLNIHHDSQHSVKVAGIRAALYAEDEGHVFSPSATQALAMLRTWYNAGAKGQSAEPYWPLAEKFALSDGFSNLSYNVVQFYRADDSGIIAWLKNIDHNITNDLGLAPNELAILDYALVDAWNRTNAPTTQNPPGFGSDPNQWTAIYSARGGNGRFRFHYYDPVSPTDNASAIGGNSYNVTFDNIPYPNLDTLGAMRGQSYSQFVDFSNVDNAQAISPITVTDNPNSPYWLAQSNEFASHDLRPAPLSRARVDTIMDSQSVIYKP